VEQPVMEEQEELVFQIVLLVLKYIMAAAAEVV
jgi:hypothetical protein